MAAIAHGSAEQTTDQTHTGDTNWTTKVTASASGFVAGGTYLIVATAQVGGSDANQQVGARLAHGATPTAFTETELVLEPTSATAGRRHDWSVALVFEQPGGGAEDIVFQIKTFDSSDTVRADSIVIWWMRLDADLTTPGDYAYDADASATTHTTTFQGFASVTITAAASEDWLILACARFDVGSVTNQCQYRINRDSDTEVVPQWSYESENAAEFGVHLLSRVYTLSSGSHTFTVEGRDASSAANAHTHSFLIAIRLGAFQDAGFYWNAGAATTTATDFAVEAANVDITPSVGADFLILVTAQIDYNSAGGRPLHRLQLGGTTIPTGMDANTVAESNDQGNDIGGPVAQVVQRTFAASAQDVDYDIGGSFVGGLDWINRSLIVLSMELDAGSILVEIDLAGTLTTAGAAALQANKPLAGTLTTAGALTRQVSKGLAGTLATSGTLTRQVSRLLAGTLATAGALASQANKGLAGTLTTSGALTVQRILAVALAGTLTTAGALVRQVQASYAGTLSTAGTFSKQVQSSYAGTLATSGALTAVRVLSVLLAGTLATSGALTLQVQQVYTGTLATAGTLTRQVNRLLAGTLATAGDLSVVKAVEVALSGTLTTAGALTRQVSKGLAGTLATSGALTKQVAKGLGGVLATSGTAAFKLVLPPPIRVAVNAVNTAIVSVLSGAAAVLSLVRGGSGDLAVNSGETAAVDVNPGETAAVAVRSGDTASVEVNPGE